MLSEWNEIECQTPFLCQRSMTSTEISARDANAAAEGMRLHLSQSVQLRAHLTQERPDHSTSVPRSRAGRRRRCGAR